MTAIHAETVNTVAFIGNYPPRKCGIATFTQDIRDAVADRYPQSNCFVCAVNDMPDVYEYPDVVRFEIEERERASYRRAAEYLNVSNVDVVCIQHEFGIYGGDAGSYVLDLAEDISAPIITTLHTILEEPTPQQRQVLRKLTALSARVVVMSQHAKAILAATYCVPDSKIDVIPHGIPDMPFVDSSFNKDKIGAEDKCVLLTFGLLSANKGIEHVIEAMPGILEDFPDVVYIVLGATHPNILRCEGEEYRRRLERRVMDLGLGESVKFHDRYVELEELKEYIAAADMYITPYLNRAQITSGTLAYAFGCGKAVISTPYLHAEELLADDSGVLVPFADPAGISQAVVELLRDGSRRNGMRKRAYLLGREMIWSKVAAHYMNAFALARIRPSNAVGRRPSSAGSPAANPNAVTIGIGRSLPAIRLDHLRRMTDSTGMVQHARFAFPHFESGYCTDDNARALAFAVTLDCNLSRASENGPRCSDLVTPYASFMNAAFNWEIGQFRNFMSYERCWLDDCGSDDCQGRSLLALGICSSKSGDARIRHWAGGLFHTAVPGILSTKSPRAWANALLGIDAYLGAFAGDRSVQKIAGQLETRLIDLFNSSQSTEWPWFEGSLTYDNALLPAALIARGHDKGDNAMLNIGLVSLSWLVSQQTAEAGHFSPIGSNGFYTSGKERALFDQQPIEAAGMVSACLTAYRASGAEHWVGCAWNALEWFYGKNDVGVAIYDPETGGCNDGLSVDRVNKNQGAESTLAYLTARVEMDAVAKMRSRTLTMVDGFHGRRLPGGELINTSAASRRREPNAMATMVK